MSAIVKKQFSDAIVDDVRQGVVTGRLRPGQQLAPEVELAEYYGVGLRAVRKAMQHLEAEGTVFRKKGKGTFISSRDSRDDTCIALIFNQLLCYPNMGFLKGIHDVFGPEKSLKMCDCDGDIAKEIAYVEKLSREKCGVILCSMADEENNAHILRLINSPGIRLVLIDRYFSNINNADIVSADHFNGTYLATRHLIDRHYRRIGYVSNGQKVFPAMERRMGYCKAMLEAGCEDPSLVAVESGTTFAEIGFKGARKLIEQRQADALVCINDDVAIGCLRYLREKGIKLGKEVGVVGFDDTEGISGVPIGLTSVRQNFVEIGNAAAKILAERMKTRQSFHPKKVIVPVELVQRDSSSRN